ncbi:MAG TPA: PH domain-containing protein [Candidatus Saccharimonadia bacterium]|nr:PH domain-containing protein [Candidatus Saccharimonadia bacterium]
MAKRKHFDDQLDDEEVLLVFRKHPIVMRKGLIFSMVILVFGVVPSLFKPEISFFFIGLGVGFVAGLLVFSPYWIAWYYSVYIITTQRLIQITQKGLFHKSVVDIGLNQIQMVNYEINGFQETLLGFGTIIIQTYMGDLTIHDAHHPKKVQKEILGILRNAGVMAVGPPIGKDLDFEEDSLD